VALFAICGHEAINKCGSVYVAPFRRRLADEDFAKELDRLDNQLEEELTQDPNQVRGER
jgi:hypothetical protein